MPRDREHDARLELRIPAELKAWTKAEARRRGTDTSDFVRELLVRERVTVDRAALAQRAPVTPEARA